MARKLASDLRNIPVVTSLPTGTDGMEIYYRFTQTVTPVDAQVLLWHLVWDAAISKWLPVGAQEPVMARDNGNQSAAISANAWNTPYVNFTSAAVPLAGTYRMSFGIGKFWINAAGNWYTAINVNGFPSPNGTQPSSGAIATAEAGSFYSGMHGTWKGPLVAAFGYTFGLYSTVAGTADSQGQYLQIYPVQI